MAEFQTVAAAIDLAALTVKLCYFLKRVKDAGSVAKDASDRIERLGKVLNGVRIVISESEQDESVAKQNDAKEAVDRVQDSITACSVILRQIEVEILGPADQGGQAADVGFARRFKIASRQRTISRLQREVETHLNALQLNLNVLQVYNQNALRSQVDSHHEEMLVVLNRLDSQRQVASQVQHSLSRAPSVVQDGIQELAIEEEPPGRLDEDALRILSASIAAAEAVYERYSLEYNPDARSERGQNALVAAQQAPSISSFQAPDTERVLSEEHSGWTSSSALASSDDLDLADREDLPDEFLDLFILQHHEHFRSEFAKTKFTQAEISLSEAIRYSEMREHAYRRPFANRAELHEELAVVHQKQGRWAEAVKEVLELVRKGGPPSGVAGKLVQARQHQMLASIYYDRHRNSGGMPLHTDKDDLASGNNHALVAYKLREQIIRSEEVPEAEVDERRRQRECLQLLIDISEAQGKSTEAGVLKGLLHEGSSASSESTRRVSEATTRPMTDYELVENKQDLLLEAIRTNNSEQMQDFLSSNDFDLEQLQPREKTALLMNAVEREDEIALQKLLSPVNGADIDARSRKGVTALHLAASKGSRAMVERLSKHDPKINIKDKVGETALLKAVEGNHLAVVELLSDLDANFETRYEDEWTVLHYAVRQSSPEMTSLILAIAPQIRDQVDRRGLTALHHCAEQSLLEQARALLDHGNRVDVNVQDSALRTPLFFAVQGPDTASRRSMVELLVKHNASATTGRRHPRFDDYAALRPTSAARKLPRHDSISTQGTTNTSSSSISRLSSMFSRRM